MRKSPYLVYGLLALCWLAIVVWQVIEHRRVIGFVEIGQLNHAHDVANSLGVVIRSQRRHGAVSRDRLEGALKDLADSPELLGIALLNPAGENIASGGRTIPGDLTTLAPGTARHQADSLIVASLVELGADQYALGRNRPADWTEEDEEKAAAAVVWNPEQTLPPPSPEGDAGADRDSRRARWEAMRQAHPFYQSPEKYKEIFEKSGLHMMVLMLDSTNAKAVADRDTLVRIAMGLVALAAVIGLAIAWRGFAHSSELQLRLVRARAMNSYLQELNLAAAGLAHETRNPLNVVRGITQVIARDPTTPDVARRQLGTALEEVDRVTARLNEFIDYSKPRDPQLAPTSPTDVARDIARALETDLEDKHITLDCADESIKVMADATMLRQVLFNLVLNAIQAVPEGGHIGLTLSTEAASVSLQIIDNGPGVPENAREDIFRPYFTLSEHGSGLGLAVVRQIALAHNWEVTYHPGPQGGSIFALKGMELA